MAEEENEILECLLASPTLHDVPRAQLEWMAGLMERVAYKTGDEVSPKGSEPQHLAVVCRGEVRTGADTEALGMGVWRWEKGGIFGVLPYSRLRQVANTLFADGDTTVARLHRDHFNELICGHHELAGALVHHMTDRARDYVRGQQEVSRMASLGMMSAGLAHELGNPVAAVVRSVEALKKHLSYTPEAFKATMKINATDEQVERVSALIAEKLGATPPSLGMMEKSEREDELTDYLEGLGLPNASELAIELVEHGLKPDELEAALKNVAPERKGAVVGWIHNNMLTENLVRDIAEASKRIDGLVKSVKSYSRMDSGGGPEAVSVPEGLRSTLTLLGHKIRANRVKVTEQLPADLPSVCASAGELNQVWTNLIDNALDAMEGGGELTLTAGRKDGHVRITVADTGPGIPPDVQKRMFEPFFTTKPVGKGTGLGLDIVQNLLKHNKGQINVESSDNGTAFHVDLPVA